MGREALMDVAMLTDAAVHEFLTARFGAEICGLASIGHGEWSRAFSYQCASRDYVIRFSTLREDFEKDQWASRFAAPALPIPRMVEVGTAFDGFYAVSERVFGAYLDDLDEAGMRQVLPALFAALDAARVADLGATVGFGGWGADG